MNGLGSGVLICRRMCLLQRQNRITQIQAGMVTHTISVLMGSHWAWRHCRGIICWVWLFPPTKINPPCKSIFASLMLLRLCYGGNLQCVDVRVQGARVCAAPFSQMRCGIAALVLCRKGSLPCSSNQPSTSKFLQSVFSLSLIVLDCFSLIHMQQQCCQTVSAHALLYTKISFLPFYADVGV